MLNENKYVRFLELESFPEETQKVLSDYICPLCQGVIYEPQTDLCGHLFCSECINTHKKNSKYCPIYKDKLLKVQDIIVVKNIINGKKMNCKNFPKCLWKEKVGLYKNHLLNDCLYEKVLCSRCKNHIIRKEYQFHSTECMETLEESDKCQDSIKKLCVYPTCDIKFTDINTHLIDSKLAHEKLFIKLFNEFKKLTEERITKLELNLNKKKLRSDEKEEIELDSESESLENSSIDSEKKPTNKKQKLVTSPRYLRKKTKDKSDHVNKIERDEVFSINSDVNKESLENDVVKKFSKKNKFKTSDEESIMNVTEFSRGIKIIGNRVINKGTTVKHRFAFMSIYLNENSLKWTVEIVNIKEWVGLGVCLKDEIISSGYKFEKPLLHSTFLITSNGYIWNCRNQLENGSQIKNLCLKDNDVVKFKYLLNERTLIAKYNGNRIQLTNIYSPKLNFLVPCVILLHENDQVEFNVVN
jgi:hypothetical protein